MSRHETSLDRSYFEDMYARDQDPWKFRTSAYESAKYAATLAALPRPRFASALEVGCSVGVFSRRLASRCERLLAIDTSERALAAARIECEAVPNVTFRRASVPADYPPGPFDLVVLSEVLYYFTAEDVRALAAACLASLSRDGAVVLCHWLGDTDYPLSGDAAATAFLDATIGRLPVRRSTRDPAYRLDLLTAV